MASTSKPRQPRLRASCDGCFLAKVKCSKARPICSRCLACGIECRYSPSSRAGKPKSDNSSHNGSAAAEVHAFSPLSDEKGLVYATQPANVAGLFGVETGWHTPPHVDGVMSRSHSLSPGMALMGVEDRQQMLATRPDAYSATVAWTPPTDLPSAPFTESPLAAPTPSHVRSHSYDMAMSATATWTETATADYQPYGQGQQVPTPVSMASNYFPGMSAAPDVRPPLTRQKMSPMGPAGNHASCTCFTVCLQSLQALHNASSPTSPPFDLVLSLNRKAVEGCAVLLACARCMGRSGTHTAAMLLATVIGKITSFYKNASQTYFEARPAGGAPPSAAAAGLGVSLGTYQLNGEDGRWLELEILTRELRKLEEVYTRFREVCAELSEDPEVSKAMIGYLGNTLGSMLEVITHRKGHMAYV